MLQWWGTHSPARVGGLQPLLVLSLRDHRFLGPVLCLWSHILRGPSWLLTLRSSNLGSATYSSGEIVYSDEGKVWASVSLAMRVRMPRSKSKEVEVDVCGLPISDPSGRAMVSGLAPNVIAEMVSALQSMELEKGWRPDIGEEQWVRGSQRGWGSLMSGEGIYKAIVCRLLACFLSPSTFSCLALSSTHISLSIN